MPEVMDLPSSTSAATSAASSRSSSRCSPRRSPIGSGALGRAGGPDHPDRRGAGLGVSSQAIGLSTGQKITLLSAGAGAGIAATFNTPLGGVLFAIEILLPEVSNRTFLPVVIATGAATLLGRILDRPQPGLHRPLRSSFRPPVPSASRRRSPSSGPPGALCGVASWAFIRLPRVHGGRLPEAAGQYLHAKHHRHGAGRPDDGSASSTAFGHSYVDGVGYGVIQSILDQGMTATGLLVLLFALKTPGHHGRPRRGASGGIFSPLRSILAQRLARLFASSPPSSCPTPA